MKKILILTALVLSLVAPVMAGQEKGKTKVVLLISEQNISGERRAWWAGEVDLSAIEARIAAKLLDAGLEVIDPSLVSGNIATDKAFRIVDIADNASVKLGKIAGADFVIVGKAIASQGGNVPQSSMKSCYANVTARVIGLPKGNVIAYLDAVGNSAHPDAITGGREALESAGELLAEKIVKAISVKGN